MVSSTRRSARLTSDNKTAVDAASAKVHKEPVVKAAASKTKKNNKKKKESPVITKKKTSVVIASDSSSSSSNKNNKRKIVIIEACKQCNAFKSRALKILKVVGDKATVQINNEKPGKGNFVVTIVGIDEPIISLLGMKRPFPSLKALDMDAINKKVMSAL